MKDRPYTPEEIQKKFDALPEDIKSLVYGADMLNLLQTLGQKYKLHVDQIGILEAETADVMTGFSKLEEFVPHLVESLSIDKTAAENLAKDINNGLFAKIRESMKKAYEADKEGTPVSISKPPAEMHPADLMLTQKSVTTAPVIAPAAAKTPPPPQTEPAKPKPYSADPYREPIQ